MPKSIGRSGNDFIACELCGHMLHWDWETHQWLHTETEKVECEEPEHKEHYESVG